MVALVEDTRQKAGKHENKHRYWEETGTSWVRSALPFGDYWPVPRVAVDTKEDIKEIASNMCGAVKERRRFTEECKKARNAGCKLIILIEDPKYNEIDDLWGERIWIHTGQTIPGDQLAKAMFVMQDRYGIEFWFCDPEESGRVIKELLDE